jgi:D-alanyl-D-alanine carboxypeptidase (penicillin-binding protein 5/6)
LILAREYLREFPESLNIHSQQYFTYRHITQHNRNALLKTYPDVDGLKTGWIHQSGYHIIATARRGDTRLIAVVMGAKNPKTRNREAERLLDQGFHLVAEGQQRG